MPTTFSACSRRPDHPKRAQIVVVERTYIVVVEPFFPDDTFIVGNVENSVVEIFDGVRQRLQSLGQRCLFWA